MVAKDRRSSMEPAKGEVGEIDTSAPFQSVKDAVTLFGEGAFSGEKPGIKKQKQHSAERYLAKESQLLLAQKELEKLRNQLKNAETMKAEALTELAKSKTTVEDLRQQLSIITESKNSVVNAAEMAIEMIRKNDGLKMNDLECTRDQYVVVFDELVSAKQELRKITQERDASLNEKLAALHQADDAEHAAKVNEGRIDELTKEISVLQEAIHDVNGAYLQEKEEHARVISEKDVQRKEYKAGLENSSKKLEELKIECDADFSQNLEKRLKESENAIQYLQREMEIAKESDLVMAGRVDSEICQSREKLRNLEEEDARLRNMFESLKMELENVTKEHHLLLEKEAETETIAGNLHAKLRELKSELEIAVAEESKARGASEELILTLHQMYVEAENARKEAEEMKKKAEELKKEAESTRDAVQESERKLVIALDEAEEAKIAEASALDQIKTLSERTNFARTSTSDSDARITLSMEEFEALSRKVEESDSLTEMKVSAAMANVEAVKASENEAAKRLETMKKEMEDMKAETGVALKRAEMAEAAKKAVEGELRRWREREQRRAAEMANRILAESGVSSESSPKFLPHAQDPSPRKVVHKLEKSRSAIMKKQFVPTISGIFYRKKSQVEVGSPSYLPGEATV